MSSHSLKAKRRHPDPISYKRRSFQIAHITVEVADHPQNGMTFALIAGHAATAKDRRPLFTGFVEPDMAGQLRALADHIEGMNG